MTTTTAANTVHEVRHLSDTAFVVRCERGKMLFQPGQYVTVGLAGDLHVREYSIYSSPDDPYLEILVKEVEGGLVSRKLRALKPGDSLQVEGPFGYFVLDDVPSDAPVLMIATGTGISPFHSMLRAYPHIDAVLLHGVRTSAENYDWQEYSNRKLIRCVSRAPESSSNHNSIDYHGRVTDYLRAHPRTDSTTHCFLCGNCDMIYEAFDILQEQGIPSRQLFAEVYF